MTQRYSCDIALTVLGPFLTAATGPDRYGVDKSAHRDHKGQLVIPASHLKGKLRSALEELEPYFDAASQPDLNELFGAPSAQDTYDPIPARLRFGNLVYKGDEREGTRSRVTINRVSQTARENLLREVEEPFASGSEITFRGKVTFSAADLDGAKAIANVLRVGLRWIAAVGSEKGVGFGRLKTAQVGAPAVTLAAAGLAPFSDRFDTLHLRITALEPLLAGGTKSRRTNYLMSRQELPGSLIKGALAAALNEAHGVTPVTRPLDPSCAGDFPEYGTLVTHFSAIRVTHAWPALAGAPRPVRLPLSAVEYNGVLAGDVALSDAQTPLIEGKYSPAYFGDAKHLEPYAGRETPMEVFVTRSEIDDVSQRTAEGQLFTYQFYAPHNKPAQHDEPPQPIEWICNVDFTAIADASERRAAQQQFAGVVMEHLHRLGKLGRAVSVVVGGGPAEPATGSRALVEDGLALVTLQSDAIMLAPDVVRVLPLGESLHEAYAAYWHELSGGALALVDFFAHQGFEGGYLYHRYLGSAERTARPNQYRPYYLTLAGSVFKLRVQDQTKATTHLAQWLACGLPFAKWARAEYGQYNRELWENCPFVPENGYGEIAVNLAWHWDQCI